MDGNNTIYDVHRVKVASLWQPQKVESAPTFLYQFNCVSSFKLWTNNADVEAAKRIIAREKERIKERLKGHYENDVWEKRDKPPSKDEWNKPLPQYMIDKQEHSYLALWAKTQEEKDEDKEAELKAMSKASSLINSVPSCTIL